MATTFGQVIRFCNLYLSKTLQNLSENPDGAVRGFRIKMQPRRNDISNCRSCSDYVDFDSLDNACMSRFSRYSPSRGRPRVEGPLRGLRVN